MSHVLLVLADPASPVPIDALIARAGRMLADAPPALETQGAPRILAPAAAAEIAFVASGAFDGKALAARIREALAPAPVDVAVVPAAMRRKKLLVADMDSTMIGQECIDELADMLNLKTEVSAITERAMRGELDFEPALRERVALLAELEESVIAEVIEARITLTPGARTLVQTMRAQGAFTSLVSGGFTAFTETVAEKLGFHETRANQLLFENGRLTGMVAEPILGRQAKVDALLAHRQRLGLAPEEVIAVGDGANDLAMLDEAGLGVAFRAKPAVAEAADIRIDHADLTALLHLQGYARSDFAQ